MNFDTGLLDRLFGKRIQITMNTESGPKSLLVTEKWFAKMVAEGKISPVDDPGQTQEPQSRDENAGAARDTRRLEIPIEVAVTKFLNEIREHVLSKWPDLAVQLPGILPSVEDDLLQVAQGEVSKMLMCHAMYAVELCKSRTVYPYALAAQVERMTIDTISANSARSGDTFANITQRFIREIEFAEASDRDPLYGVAFEMAAFIETHSSKAVPNESHEELAIAMLAVAKSLQVGWWQLFASRAKLELGA